MQRVVAYQAGPLGGGAPFARGRLEPARQRVPVELDRAVRLAPAQLHREALHRRHELQRLHPELFNAVGLPLLGPPCNT